MVLLLAFHLPLLTTCLLVSQESSPGLRVAMKMRRGASIPSMWASRPPLFVFLHLEGDKCLDLRIGSNCRDHVTLELSPAARANAMERDRHACRERGINWYLCGAMHGGMYMCNVCACIHTHTGFISLFSYSGSWGYSQCYTASLLKLILCSGPWIKGELCFMFTGFLQQS